MTDNKRSVKSHKRRLLIASPILILLLVLLFSGADHPVQSFCSVYAEEDIRLASLPGDTYPSGVFNENVSDAGEFAKSFARLEEVAPQEIESDVTSLKRIYETIHKDPAQTISAGLSGVQAEEAVVKWIDLNCSDQ